MISFNEIKKVFPKKDWDVGVITKEQLAQAAYAPIKTKFHYKGYDFTNSIHFEGLTNSIVLVRRGETWDYSFYDEAVEILKKHGFTKWYQIYTNFKEAAMLAGLGVRAKNSLVYSYRFGFDSHICVFGFEDTIVDVPTNKRINTKYWRRCRGCDDCAKACPVGAIHNSKEPYWLDSSACETFIGVSDHPSIPSIKKFWHINVHPEINKQTIDSIKTLADAERIIGTSNLPFDANGYAYDGFVTTKDGKKITVPVCRECTSQPRCSKWGGKFPYQGL
jgi:ferredoxin